MNDIELFGKEKIMTVKEVAEVLGVTERTVQKYLYNLFPELVKQGVKSNITETIFQALKDSLVKNKFLKSEQAFDVISDIDIEEMTLKVIEYHKNKVIQLQKENEILKPKALVYDSFLSAENWMTGNEAAKVLGIGRNKMYNILRNRRIWMDNNTPYQPFMDMREENRYFKVIEKPVEMAGKTINKPQTLISAKGLEYIKKVIK